MEDKIYTGDPSEMSSSLTTLDYRFSRLSSSVSTARRKSIEFQIFTDTYKIARNIGRTIDFLYNDTGHSLSIVGLSRILLELIASSHYVTTRAKTTPNIQEMFARNGRVISGKKNKKGGHEYVTYSTMISSLPVNAGETWPSEFYRQYSSAIHFDTETINLLSNTEMEEHAYIIATKTIDLLSAVFKLLLEMGYAKA